MNDRKRMNINVPSKLLNAVDEYASDMSLTRTSAVIVLINTALEQKNTVDVMQKMLEEIKKEV